MLKESIFQSGTVESSSREIVTDFISPALNCAKFYDRGVGYFSSGWLRMASSGMAAFAKNAGRARWVTSPILSESDWGALYSGEQAKVDNLLKEALGKAIIDLELALQHDTLIALSWMIADGILDFRLAVPREKLIGGEFHDKFGIFTDIEGNRVSFNGSYNDSIQGSRNYESIKVFCSWEPAFSPLVKSDSQRFERLWNNEDPNVRVYPLPDAAREQILKLRPADRPYPRPPWIEAEPVVAAPSLVTPPSATPPAVYPARVDDEAVGDALSEAPDFRPNGSCCRPSSRSAIISGKLSGLGAPTTGAASLPWPPVQAKPSLR